MKYQNNRRHILPLVVMVFAVMSVFGSAEAMRFQSGDDTTIDCDVTLSWAGGWRIKDRDLNSKSLKDVNGNDGEWNFDKWDMMNNRFTGIADIDVQYKNVGIFARPRAFYDYVYMTDNSNPGLAKHPTNNNYLAGAISAPDKFAKEVEDVMGTKTEFLDYFAYANFAMAGRQVDLRVGQQVIAWGEQLYLSGGVASAMSHADLTAANLPGVELKEVYLPSKSVSLRMDLVDNVSWAGFYQWEWKSHVLNESGSYFSDTDMLDKAGHGLITGYGVFRRVTDEDAKDDGQYGLSMMFRIPKLSETELGFYYINYHEKSPMLLIAYPTYHTAFAEDVKLYGFSFSSFIRSVSLSGEFTYRHDYPLNIRTGVYEDGNMVQAQLAWLYSLGQNPVFDDVSINGEIGCNKVLGMEYKKDMLPSDYSWGYALAVTPKYYQVIPNLDMEFPLVYKGNPSGSSPNKTFIEGADSASVGTTFTYKNVYKLELKYVNYFNAVRNVLMDRDIIGVNLKYTF